jgi:hypothetical protein
MVKPPALSQKTWDEMLALRKADRVRAKQRKAARMGAGGAAFGSGANQVAASCV